MAVRGYVYFVACAESECRKAHPFIKIGHTMKLENRLAALQTGSPVELAFVGYVRTEDPKSLERYLHKTFERAWLYGEWYRLSKGMIVTLRHYNIVNDKFDEFFTEPPKFEMDPTAKAWMVLARRLELELAKYTGKLIINMPFVKDNDDRRCEWNRIKR